LQSFIQVCAGRVDEIAFVRPSTKRRLSEISSTHSSPESTPPRKRTQSIPPPTQADLDACYAILYQSDPKPAILRVIDGYADKFFPQSRNPKYPKPLSYLYDPKTLDYGFLQLLKECEHIYKSVQVRKKIGGMRQSIGSNIFKI
jgi:hypothetical protein